VPGWVVQSLTTIPAMNAAVEVDGVWYLNTRHLNGLPFNPNGSRELVRVNSDGTYTTIPFPANGSQGEPAWKSMIAVGTKIYIGIFSANTNAEIRVYDTVAGTWALVTIAGGGSFPGFGEPALGPDGLIYFPPFGGPATNRPLVFNPSTNTMSFTNFGSTWPVVSGGEDTGHFCMGGDGNMYFLPGNITAWASGFQSGTKWGYISGWPSPTVTDLGALPLDNPGASPGTASTWIWAMPAADGIYAMTMGRTFYKITTAGAQWLMSSNPFNTPPYNAPSSELSNSANFQSNAILGPDGLIYTVGGVSLGSNNFVPTVAYLDPSTDEVHFQQYSSFTGHPFVGTVSHVHNGMLRTWPVRVGSSGAPSLIVDMWEHEFYGSVGGWSIAVGDNPVSLAVGDSPFSLWVG
jgi:hypothetical protein